MEEKERKETKKKRKERKTTTCNVHKLHSTKFSFSSQELFNWSRNYIYLLLPPHVL